MKLEEVLPAMRAGRVAVNEGWRYTMRDGVLMLSHGSSWIFLTQQLPLDGWTLEPEPKVEWPKGSLQWAETEANRNGLTYVKRRSYHVSIPVVNLQHHILDVASRHALDWEVVL